MKAKARLMVDEQGQAVNPEDGEGTVWIQNKHRVVLCDRDELIAPRELMF